MTPIKNLTAGMLRHRIAIDRQTYNQDPTTGAVDTVWFEIAANVAALVEPLTGQAAMEAAQRASTVAAHITIRQRADLDPAMRIRHRELTYRIKAIMADPKSGLEWQCLLVESE